MLPVNKKESVDINFKVLFEFALQLVAKTTHKSRVVSVI